MENRDDQYRIHLLNTKNSCLVAKMLCHNFTHIFGLIDIGVLYMGFGHWGWMLGVPKSFFGRWVFGRWGFWTLEVLDVGKFWTLKVFGRWGF